MPSHPGLDHAIVHGDSHAGRVRIVPNAEAERASAELLLLFPHETIEQTALGCCHTCVYTSTTPPSVVAERIQDHALRFDHATGEPRTRRTAEVHEGLGKEAAI